MPIETFPTLASDDPDPDTWVEMPYEDPTMRSKKMSGLLTTRARYTRVPKTWQFDYRLLSDSDKQILEIFERDTVNYGALMFHWRSFQEAYGAPLWTADTNVTLGRIVMPTAANGRSYRCTTAGKTHTTAQPTWPATVGGTVNDGTVTWTENTYLVRFAAPIKFAVGARIDFWKASVSLVGA